MNLKDQKIKRRIKLAKIRLPAEKNLIEQQIMKHGIKAIAVTALGFGLGLSARADFINGDFSTNTITEMVNFGVSPNEADLGWYADLTYWSISGGEAHRLLQGARTSVLGLGQFVQDSQSTTGQVTFSFDWSFTGNTEEDSTSTLRYDVFGTNTNTSSDKIGINNDSYGTGLTLLASETLTGLAPNASGAVSTVVDFGTGYEYVAVRIAPTTSAGFLSNHKNNIDNVSFVAIPEPASIWMVGLCGLVFFIRRRPILQR